jgi:hypothetical protein
MKRWLVIRTFQERGVGGLHAPVFGLLKVRVAFRHTNYRVNGRPIIAQWR